MIAEILNVFLHVDQNLMFLTQSYGAVVYGLLFLVIFFETGLVITPFLPGDSLIFAAGALSGAGLLNVFLLFVLLSIAAILGDTLNYWVGNSVGARVFTEKSRFFKKEYLNMTEKYYHEHGGKTIIFARYIPIIRTFAPFVAGIGNMKYSRFLWFNIFGGITWVAVWVFGGYFFGSIPFVKAHFSLFTLLIIIVSLLPFPIEMIAKELRKRRKSLRKINYQL